MPEHHDVIVIGAGLSGLYAAWRLQRQQVDVLVLEARPRIGGRILSASPRGQESAVDLGPAWIWPAFQPRMKALVDELGLSLFRQHVQGDMLYEMDASRIHRHAGPSSHGQSYRIAGGNAALVQALRSGLPETSLHEQTRVFTIRREGLEIEAEREGRRVRYTAEHLILALPPRLLSETVVLEPAPAEATREAWKNIPTWMAGHCKMVFVYRAPFWRAQGLSGEVFSRHGPLSEIYDGSPADVSFHALTAFVGLDARRRRQLSDDALHAACLGQLERLFGPAGRDIQEVLVRDWSRESLTATALDQDGAPHHPEYPPGMPRQLWNGRLLLAGTELAREHGGYLEGALESAEEAVNALA